MMNSFFCLFGLNKEFGCICLCVGVFVCMLCVGVFVFVCVYFEIRNRN